MKFGCSVFIYSAVRFWPSGPDSNLVILIRSSELDTMFKSVTEGKGEVKNIKISMTSFMNDP